MMHKIYVLYRNYKYEYIDIADFKYSSKIKLVLVPMLNMRDPVFIPVEPEVLDLFHHATASIIFTHYSISLENNSDCDSYRSFGEDGRVFYDVIAFINYIHTIHRMDGFEAYRRLGYTEFPDYVQAFTVARMAITIYDKTDKVIFQTKMRSRKEVTYETIMNEVSYSKNSYTGFNKAIRKLYPIIPKINFVPFDPAKIRLLDNSEWEFSPDLDSQHINEFTYCSAMKAFYLEKDSSSMILSKICKKAVKLMVSLIIFNSTELPELTSPISSDELNDIIISGDSAYYDQYCIENLDSTQILGFSVFLPVIVSYLIFEANFIIFPTDNVSNVVVVRYTYHVNGRQHQYCFPYYEHKSLKKLVKGLINHE